IIVVWVSWQYQIDWHFCDKCFSRDIRRYNVLTSIETPVKVTIARGVLDNMADLVTEEIFDWLKKKKIAEDN
ncbi:1149_t:CDS:1, partial [Gigaspora margarita]